MELDEMWHLIQKKRTNTKSDYFMIVMVSAYVQLNWDKEIPLHAKNFS